MLQRDAQGTAEALSFNNDGVINTVEPNYSSRAVQVDGGNLLEVTLSVEAAPSFLHLIDTGWLEVTARAHTLCASGSEMRAKGGVLQLSALLPLNGLFRVSIANHNGSSFAQSYRRTTLLTAHPRPWYTAEYHS